MLGFSAGLTSNSRKQKLPVPLKMPEFKSATTADPSTYTKKRREKSEKDEGTESKNTTAKPVIPRKSQAATRRVTPIVDAGRESSTERRLRYAAGLTLTSSSRKQISPKPLKRPEPAATVIPPTSTKVVPTRKVVSPKKIIPPTSKKEEDKKFESTNTTAKSVIPRSQSQVSTRGRDSNIEKQLRFSGGLTSSFREQKSSKPLKKPEPTLLSPKKRQEESEGENGFESTTTTVKSPSSKSRSTTITGPRYSNVEKHIEKHFPNGELYIGSFSANSFHGSGKYLWKDGSMYEGEWKKGNATGKGKFSWPSGATYTGEFKSGLREGSGTFTGPDGDIYKGSWLEDQRHGHGVRYYCNGNYYEGNWWRNLQDGQGQYVWKNGDKYTGEWKNGMINGKGILVLVNGNMYEGNWENGVPKENAVLTWPDGSCYVGSWVKCGKNQVVNGTFSPSLNNNDGSMVAGSLMMDGGFCRWGTGNKGSSVDCGGSGSMAGRNSPRICIWVSDAEAGDVTGDIIHSVEASIMYRKGSGFERGVGKQFQRNPCSPGMPISKGHKNYDLMLNLQLGIRHSVEKDAFNIRGLKLSDYDPKEKFWTRFPLEGSKSTPPHQSADFRWKDYCPMVFRHLRQLFQVDPADYMLAICGCDALREFSSPGKSGSLFYLTQDDRFIIKTVKKSEAKVLIKMLRSYHNHVRRYENSLVTKFYGVHCVKPVGGTKTRFIVMGNLFCSEYRIQRRFDLKGSSYGRTIDKAEGDIDETTTLKDLDLNYVFRLQENSHEELIRQIQRDCEFLESEKIMDYSFLVGMHFSDNNTGDKMGLSPYSYQNEKFMRSFRSDQKPLIRLGAHMPAKAERVARKGDFDQYTPGGEIYEVALYFGVIDILQNYDISKKLEHAYKSLQVDSTSISAVDPKLYSKRFQDFIGRVFLPDST